jgi:ribosome-binding protein aMBF1 (putative translation factor)
VQWSARPLAQNLPIPDGFEDINDIVEELEQAPAARAQFEAARKQLAAELPIDKTSLAAFRLARGWSQKRLADEIGTSQSHIARIENGRGNVLLNTANDLAAALGVTLEEVSRALGCLKPK